MLRLLRPWDSQPQEAVRVDRNNPLTNGLVFLAPMWPGQLDDVVGGKKATVTGTLGFAATKDGVFPLFSGSQYIDYGAFGAEFPAGPATIAWIQTPIAQSGFNTLMNLMPNGGVNSWVCYQNGGGGAYAFTFGRRAGTGQANYNTTVGAPVNGDTRRFIVRSPSLDTATTGDYSLFNGFAGPLAPDGNAPYGGNSSTGMRIGALLPSGGDGFDGAVGMVAIWNRQLSDDEARSYNANPWQILEPQTIWVPVSAGGGPTYTLTADGGAYAHTGGTAGLVAGRKIAAAGGSYTHTGGTAGLQAGRKIAADGGAFTHTGGAAGLVAGRKLAADGGAYAFTGGDADLVYTPVSGAYTLTAEGGTFVLTGGSIADVATTRRHAGWRQQTRRGYIIKGKRYWLTEDELMALVAQEITAISRKDVKQITKTKPKVISKQVWDAIKPLERLEALTPIEQVQDDDEEDVLMMFV